MGKQQINTGKGNQTVNTNSVWDRIVNLENNTGVGNNGLAGRMNSVESFLAEMANLTDHTITYSYYPDGNIQTVTEKDSNNIVVQTVTYNYNVSGDVSTSVTVKNGKTYTTTYNYDGNGNIQSTSNVIS